jgi:DNA-directed RNA polymerase subunit E'/Rpb7
VLCVQLSEGEYFEGVVGDINEKGIKIEFMGILEGTLRANCMHPNTRYDPDNNRWLFLQGTGEAYVWRTDAKVFFKIHKVSWHLAKQESNLSDLVLLRADESGLGPEEWWS